LGSLDMGRKIYEDFGLAKMAMDLFACS